MYHMKFSKHRVLHLCLYFIIAGSLFIAGLLPNSQQVSDKAFTVAAILYVAIGVQFVILAVNEIICRARALPSPGKQAASASSVASCRHMGTRGIQLNLV